MASHWSRFCSGITEKQAMAIDRIARLNGEGDGMDVLMRLTGCSRSKVGKMDRASLRPHLDAIFDGSAFVADEPEAPEDPAVAPPAPPAPAAGKRYILNSAVITMPGVYEYRLVDAVQAREWAASAPWESTVGYAETAAVLAEILGCPVPVDRRTVRMQVGDEALVIRLSAPQGAARIDPADKGALGRALTDGSLELGLLVRRS